VRELSTDHSTVSTRTSGGSIYIVILRQGRLPVVIPGPRDDYWYPFYLRVDTHVPFVLIPGSQDPAAT